MEKYKIHEKKETVAAYCTTIRGELIDVIYEQLLRKMIVEKRYRDPALKSQTLAKEIGTNVRYISATVRLRMQQNFSDFVNGFRVRDAISMLTDKRYRGLTMAEICNMCGFANRQTFYTAFFRAEGITPKQFQANFYARIAKK